MQLSLFSCYFPTIRHKYLLQHSILLRARGCAVGWGTVLQTGRWRVRFPMVSLEFSLTSFLPHYDPGVDSASNRNEYQEYFLGGKGGRCVLRLFHVTKSYNINSFVDAKTKSWWKLIYKTIHFISWLFWAYNPFNTNGELQSNLIQWKLLIKITLGPALFDNNNRLITLSGWYKNLHYLTQFIVTTFYMYKKQRNLF
jgi:uncharacterized membrane protein YhdT